MYEGVPVGQVIIPKGKAGLRSTKKVTVTVNVNSNALPTTTGLGSELGAGVLTLNSQAIRVQVTESRSVARAEEKSRIQRIKTLNIKMLIL